MRLVIGRPSRKTDHLIRGMAPIQTDGQIRGHISWLRTDDVREALKVMHKVIAFARHQTKDVNEVKQSILYGKT